MVPGSGLPRAHSQKGVGECDQGTKTDSGGLPEACDHRPSLPPPPPLVPGATASVGESLPDNVLPPKYERALEEEAAREQLWQDWNGGGLMQAFGGFNCFS